MPEFNAQYWIAQSFAALAVLFALASTFTINRKFSIVGRGISSALHATNYLILSLYPAATVAGINAVRGFSLGAVKTRSSRSIAAGVFIFAQILSFILLPIPKDTVWAWLPLTGAIVTTVSLSVLKVTHIKMLTILGSIIWIVYFAATVLVVSLTGEIIMLILGVVALVRARQAELKANAATP